MIFLLGTAPVHGMESFGVALKHLPESGKVASESFGGITIGIWVFCRIVEAVMRQHWSRGCTSAASNTRGR